MNLLEGIKWSKKQKNAHIFSDAFVKELHRRLFGKVWSWAGKFRLTEKNIGVDPINIAVDLRNLLEDQQMLAWFQSHPPLEIAIRLHHRLVKIHLFPNGNGRHARIMTDIICLFVLNIPLINWSAGQNLQSLSKRRTEYINALRKADTGDFASLIVFAQG